MTIIQYKAAIGGFFKLNFPDETGLYCPTSGGIPEGPYTRIEGIWGYQEILQARNNDTLINLPDATVHGWTDVIDDCYKAPYMYNGPYWIGYDNEESIKIKVQYANFLEIAGVMIWSIDTDNWRGDWGQKRYPLLHVSIIIMGRANL